MPTVEAALFYHARGWVPVRVTACGKIPMGGAGWQHLRPTRDEIMKWGPHDNVGVLQGSASGWLTDVDLDCDEAIALAPHYLPPTWAFGRASKPRSHWPYIVERARSYQFKDATGKTLLEIRGEAPDGGAGYQTVMPPSWHASGEPITWDPDLGDALDGPRVIPIADFIPMMAKLARATFYMHDGASLDEARELAAKHVPQPRRRKRQEVAARLNVEVAAGAACAACGVVAEGSATWVTERVCSEACAAELAAAHLAKCPEAISGQGGRRALYVAAQALVKGFGLSEEKAIEMLEREYNPRCSPAWRAKDIRRRVVAAANKSRKPDGYLLAVVK